MIIMRWSVTAFLVLAGILSVARPAAAQASQPLNPINPTFELSGGYQFAHMPDLSLPFGLNVDGSRNFNRGLGVVGEIGWAYGSSDESGSDVDTNLFNFGAGPRWTRQTAGQFQPFAQVLAGFVYVRESSNAGGTTSDTRFMLQPGAGATVIAGDGWGIVGSVDYRRVFLDKDEFGKSGENDFRVFIGVRLLLD
jgi:Outer membrane protein beta-barrel domain